MKPDIFIDMHNQAGEPYSCGLVGWVMLLRLAERFGWCPDAAPSAAGVLDRWSTLAAGGSYRVDAHESMLISAAVRRAIGDPEWAGIAEALAREYVRTAEAVYERDYSAVDLAGVAEEYRAAFGEFARFAERGPLVVACRVGAAPPG